MKRVLGIGVAACVAATGMLFTAGPGSAVGTDATVPVGVGPFDVAVSPDSSQAYVTNRIAGSLSVLDLASNTVTKTIPLSAGVEGVAFTPDGTRAYVANSADKVTIINTATTSVAANLALAGEPADVAVTADGKYVLVPRRSVDKVSVLTVATNQQVAELSVGDEPTSVAISADGTKAYVANNASNTVSVINVNTAAGQFSVAPAAIAVGTQPRSVTTAPNLPAAAYVANGTSNDVTIINDTTVTGVVPGLSTPSGVATSADGLTVYASNAGGDTLASVNPATVSVTGNTAVGNKPLGVAVSPDGSRAVVVNAHSNNATVLSLAPRVEVKPATKIKGTTAQGNFATTTNADPTTGAWCYISTDEDQVLTGPNGTATSVAARNASVAPNQTGSSYCRFTGLKRSTTYYYLAAARDGDGTGWPTTVESFTTRPKKPNTFSSTSKRKAIIWRWAKVDTADYYQTRLRKNRAWTSWQTINRPKVRYGKLDRKKVYRVQVRAGNDAGVGPRRTKKASTR